MNDEETRAAVNAALGRIFRLASRPEQPGDIAEYERCRAIVLDCLDPLPSPHVYVYARNTPKGAQGDAP